MLVAFFLTETPVGTMSTGVPTWERDATGRLVRSEESVSPNTPGSSIADVQYDPVRLEPIIRMRRDLDTLTNEEFNIFKAHWISMIDNRDIISSSIYRYFHQDTSGEDDTYNIPNIQNCVNKIIKSRRKTTPSETNSTTPNVIYRTNNNSNNNNNYIDNDNDDILSIKELTLEPSASAQPPSITSSSSKSSNSSIIKKKKILTDLPKELIGDVASFLHAGNYIHFEQTCRTIYVACNSPSTLQELQIIVSNQLPHLNVFEYFNYDYSIRDKYPLIKSLEFSVPYFNHYLKHHLNQTPFNHLRKLRVYHVFNSDILNEFMENNNLINEALITSLTCEHFMEYIQTNLAPHFYRDFDAQDFYRFIATFPNLRQLQLIKVMTSWGTGDAHIIKDLLPNIRQLSVRDSKEELVEAIINNFGDQLESLIMSRQCCEHIFCRNGFPNLIELSLTAPSLPVMNHILEETTKLERFGVSMHHEQNMSNKELSQLMVYLLKKQHNLIYFGFDIDYKDFDDMMEAVVTSLTFTHNIYRPRLKVGFNIMKCDERIVEKANKYINKIMEQFDRIEIDSYMIELNFFPEEIDVDNIDDRLKRIRMIKSLNKKYLAIFTRVKNPNYMRFVVSNKGCTIDGYRAEWLVYK